MSPVVFWFGGWEPIVRIVVVATLGYLALVLLLRISGKRTLARMNAFDFVITVAIGAAFGRVLTARQVALAEAVTAFAVLVLLQLVVTYVQVRSSRVDRVLTAAPRLLCYRGRLLHDALRAERVTPSELEGVARLHGLGSLAEAEAIVMETDGRFSVLPPRQFGDGSTLGSVRGPDR